MQKECQQSSKQNRSQGRRDIVLRWRFFTGERSESVERRGHFSFENLARKQLIMSAQWRAIEDKHGEREKEREEIVSGKKRELPRNEKSDV